MFKKRRPVISMRWHWISIRTAKMKQWQHRMSARIQSNWNSKIVGKSMKWNNFPTFGSFYKIVLHISIDSKNSTARWLSNSNKNIYINHFTKMLVAVLRVITLKWKYSRYYNEEMNLAESHSNEMNTWHLHLHGKFSIYMKKKWNDGKEVVILCTIPFI